MRAADVGDDDRDVVGSAAVEGLLEQDVGGAARGESLAERLRGVGVVDDAGEAVRAEQPPVARLRRHDERVELGVRIHVAEHPHEDGPARVVARLFGRDAARVDEALDERVVGGDLGELVVAVQVDPRVADVRDDGVVVDHHHGADGRAHPGEFGADVHGVDQRAGGLRDAVPQGPFSIRRRRVGVVETFEPGDGDARGDVAAGVTAHAVGDEEQVRSGIAGVLVVGAHLAGVRDRGARALEDHVEGSAYARSSKVVAPTLMGAPRVTGTGVDTRAPSCQVPLVESRSCSIHCSPHRTRRAWWLEV